MKIKDMIPKVQELFSESFDVVTREFKIAGERKAVLFYIDTIAGGSRIGIEIIAPLSRLQRLPKGDIVTVATQELVNICRFQMVKTFAEAVKELLNGKTLFIIDGEKDFIILDTTQFQMRGIAEPPTNSVVLGPREGFIESAVANIGLLRKRVKHQDLTIVNNVVGKYTNTNVSVLFIKSIADKKIVDTVIKKIKDIQIDGILDSFYVMQYLQKERFNIFNQVGSSEKPDVVASKLLEGRVAIIVDGSPIVLTVPYMLIEDIQAADDYYTNSTIVSVRRFIRLFGGIFAIILPGLYLSIQLYHYNIMPLNALFFITNATENTPFTPMIELIIILVLFEIMYEAALRMPRHLGAATSLVAAVVLGGTAIQAGMLSGPAVLVAALSLMSMYILPNLAPQISLLRIVFVLLGGILGIYGLLLGGILLAIHLCNLESFATPMMAPFAPNIESDQKDALFLKDLPNRKTRPSGIPSKNKTRAS